MTTTKIQVLNGKVDGWIGEDKVYIGRSCYELVGSLLANPFPISKRCTREESIAQYKRWLFEAYRLKEDVYHEVNRLAAKVRQGDTVKLMCWCSPLACHGDIIVEFINYINKKHNEQQMETV